MAGLKRGLPLVLAAALIAVTVFAPRLPLPRERFDHLVVIDVTQSMNVADMPAADGRRATRLAFAKAALRQALEALPCGSRLGWGIFTEYRSYLLFTPIEVCANRAELRQALAGIDGRMAWSGNSEVAKGLHSAIVIARELPDRPSLVFVTDGHEAPPLSPRFRPRFDDKPGEVPGLLVGVGDGVASPIPKADAAGRPLGIWGADEVLQVDPRSLGRGASVGGEAMVDDGTGVSAAGLGATPGREHLSALREPYLQLLAAENGFAYRRLSRPDDLVEAMRSPLLARRVVVDADARIALGAAACVLLLVPYAAPLVAAWRRRRRVTAAVAAGAAR